MPLIINIQTLLWLAYLFNIDSTVQLIQYFFNRLEAYILQYRAEHGQHWVALLQFACTIMLIIS